MRSKKPFDWRDYMRLEPHNYYLDAKGNPTANLSRLEGDERRDAVARELSKRRAFSEVEKTLNQISLIPEVQKTIKTAHDILVRKAETDPDLLHDSKGRITINIDDTKTGANYEAMSISLGLKQLAATRYKTPFGYGDFSVQQAIIHELEHLADKSLSTEKDLKQAKAAFAYAVGKTLEQIPELKDEYNKSKTLGGVPVADAFGAITLDEFNKTYRDVVRGAFINTKPEKISENLEGKKDFSPSEKIPYVLGPHFTHRLNYLQDTQDELPVVAKTNSVTRRYFPFEPERKGYETITDPAKIGAYGYLPSLATHIHPEIKRGQQLAATVRCPDVVKNPDSCADRKIDDVSYGPPSDPASLFGDAIKEKTNPAIKSSKTKPAIMDFAEPGNAEKTAKTKTGAGKIPATLPDL